MSWRAVKEFLKLNKLKFCVFLALLLIFISLSSIFIIDQLTGTTILNEYHALECGFCIHYGTADKIKDCYNSIPVSPWGIAVGGTESRIRDSIARTYVEKYGYSEYHLGE